jgi:hypothetical protein
MQSAKMMPSPPSRRPPNPEKLINHALLTVVEMLIPAEKKSKRLLTPGG